MLLVNSKELKCSVLPEDSWLKDDCLQALKLPLVCHSGLDPWFDTPFDWLMVLNNVKGLTTLSGSRS